MENFKTRVEPTVEAEVKTEPKEIISDSLAGNETKLTTPLEAEEKKLEIWEGLTNRKYITEYFDIKDIAGEFNLKMQTSTIDKFIKQELEEKGYEKNIDNYNSILKEIEEEIGSSRLELFARIKKITGYAKVLNKLNELKKKKKLYLQSLDE